MKRVLKIIGIVFLIIVLAFVGLYLYADNKPAIYKWYRSDIETGGKIEEKYLGDGSYETEKLTIKAPDPIKKYTIYYTKDMTDSEGTYPMVLVVNGTGFKATKYEPQFAQLASWGYIVVGTQDKGTGSGETTIQMLNDMMEQNNNKESILYQKIDIENIGVTGFSQGGAATIRSAYMYDESHYIKTIVPLSPVSEKTATDMTDYPYDISKVKCPIFMLAGTSGEFETEIVIPFDEMTKMYDRLDAPKVMARRTGMDHDHMMYSAEGYVTAWFMWQLKGDEEAAGVFTGEKPEILSNSLYQDQRIDLEKIK